MDFISNNIISEGYISGDTLNVNRANITNLKVINYTGITDTFVTGGTYDNITETVTFKDNEGGSFGVTGFTDTSPVFVTYEELQTLINTKSIVPYKNYYLTNPDNTNEILKLSGIDSDNVSSFGDWVKFNPDWDLIDGDYSLVQQETGVTPNLEKLGTYRTVRIAVPVAPLVKVSMSVDPELVPGDIVFLVTGANVIQSEGIVAYPYDPIEGTIRIGVTSDDPWRGGAKLRTSNNVEYNIGGSVFQESVIYTEKETNIGVLKKYTSVVKGDSPVFSLDRKSTFFLVNVPYLPLTKQKLTINEYSGFGENGEWEALVLSSPISHPKEIGTGANGTVETIVQLSDGKFLIGGRFNQYNGVSRVGICRLNSDGSLDTTFVSKFQTTGNVTVNSIAVDDITNRIYLGGSFTTYDGQRRNNLVRIDLNGNLDTVFNPGPTLSNNQKGPNSSVNTILIEGTNIVIGGNFTSYNNVTRNRIARVTTTGALDTTFVPDGSGNNTGFNSYVNIIKKIDNYYLCGGNFTSYAGVTKRRLILIESNGASTPLSPNIENGEVFTIEHDGEDIYIGGSFTKINGITQPRISLIKYNSGVLTYEGITSISFRKGGFNSTVFSIRFYEDELLVTGNFTQFGQDNLVFKRNRVCKISKGGFIDTTYNVGTGANQAVKDSQIKEDGSTVVVGNFTNFNGFVAGRITIIPRIVLSQINPYNFGDIVIDYSNQSGYYHYQKINKEFILNQSNNFSLINQNYNLDIKKISVLFNGDEIFNNTQEQFLSRENFAIYLTSQLTSFGIIIGYIEDITSVNTQSYLTISGVNPSDVVIKITTGNYTSTLLPDIASDEWYKLPKTEGMGYISTIHTSEYDIQTNKITSNTDGTLNNRVTSGVDDVSDCIHKFPWGNKKWLGCNIVESEIYVSDPNFCYLSNVKIGEKSTIILNDNDTFEEDYTSCGLYNGKVGSNTTLFMKADPFYEFFSSLDNGASFLKDFSIADDINLTIPAGKIYQDAHLTKTESTFSDVIDVTLDEWESGYIISTDPLSDDFGSTFVNPLGGYLDFNRQFKQEDFDYNISYLGDIALNFPLTTFPRNELQFPQFYYGVSIYVTSFLNYNEYFDSLSSSWLPIDGKEIITTFRNANSAEVNSRKITFTELSELPSNIDRNTRFIEPIVVLDIPEPRITNINFVNTAENPYYSWIKFMTPKLGETETLRGIFFEAPIVGLLLLSNSTPTYLVDEFDTVIRAVRPISDSYVTFKINRYKYLGAVEGTVIGALYKDGVGGIIYDSEIKYDPIRDPLNPNGI